jgi:hypothetical protein
VKYWLVVSEYKNPLYDVQREKAEDWASSMAVIAEPGARTGDACILWRPGTGGGVVAIGEITRMTVERPHPFTTRGDARKRACDEAVGQAESYLRELDEARDHIFSRLHIDCRRASMTVVIGHRGHDRSGATSREIDEAIRTYNSHLSRVRVTTYDDLIENAQRMLELAAPARQPSQHFSEVSC